MSSLVVDEYKLIASITKASYFEFLKEFWSVFVPETPVWNWHIEYICNELQKVAERVLAGKPKLYDLIINVPPGTTKSSAASVAFLPWLWTRMPSLRSLNGSHTHELVLDLSRKAREIITSEKYKKCFPYVSLRFDQNTKGHFANTAGGARLSCTVGGKTPTGFHAHIHVVDDPIDPQKALSDVEVETANTWLVETLSTRKVDKAVTPLILIMQRLSQNDPSGYLLSKAKEGRFTRVKHICLPAELCDWVEPKEVANKYVDGLLDPVRLSRRVLDEYKEGGDFFYSGQFMQNPIPLGGGMFKTNYLKFSESAPEWYDFVKMVRYWDNAGSPGKSSILDRRRAYSVGVLMGMHKDKSFWVLDVIRGRFHVDEREKIKLQTAMNDARTWKNKVRIVQEQEGGSGGQESAENTVRNLAGYPVMIDIPRGNKTLRAEPFSAQVNIGNVVLLKAPWNDAYVDEMKHFPNSTYRDQIDASAGAFNTIFKMRRAVGAY